MQIFLRFALLEILESPEEVHLLFCFIRSTRSYYKTNVYDFVRSFESHKAFSIKQAFALMCCSAHPQNTLLLSLSIRA